MVKMTQLEKENVAEEIIQNGIFLYNNPEKWEYDRPLTQDERYNFSVDYIAEGLANVGICLSNDEDENILAIKLELGKAITTRQPGVAIGRL